MGDETTFEVIFRGDIAAGQQLPAVKERLKALFKIDDARVEQLFSGRPEVIKKGVDEITANRYRDTLLKAGAMVQVRLQAADTSGSNAVTGPASAPAAPVTQPAVTPDLNSELSSEATSSGALQVAPETTESGSDEWTLAPVGADVLRPDERRQVQPAVVDDIEFELAPAGADLLKPEERARVEVPEIDVSHLTVDAPEEDKAS